MSAEYFDPTGPFKYLISVAYDECPRLTLAATAFP
jgi:hypothetical protein